MANNAGNWQWVAGTGNDTRPNRVINPLRQAQRFDPRRRLRAPLRAGAGRARRAAIHTPWKLPAPQREQLGYPGPIVELS